MISCYCCPPRTADGLPRDAIANPDEQIAHIIDSTELTLMELSLLSATLPIDDDQLMQMFKKEFPTAYT